MKVKDYSLKYRFSLYFKDDVINLFISDNTQVSNSYYSVIITTLFLYFQDQSENYMNQVLF